MSVSPTLIGHRLAHYLVLEQIGAGGMGIVYRARDERLDRDVAIKVLPAGALAEQAARKRFRKEALALARLNHPNIETVHHFDTQDGLDFLVTEYILGVTLNERVAAGPLPEKEVARLGTQLAQGLASAHEAGVVHSDLKPSNLRITPDGRLKILDFGLAKLSRPMHTATTESLSEYGGAGTLPYMSPEQLHGEPAKKTSDIYGAGTVLYEMATGQKPFREELSSRLISAILHEVPVAPRAHNSRISPELERIILKCLQKDPENRYQSAVELAVDLRNVWMPTSVSAFAIRGARSTKIFRRPIAFAIVGLLLIFGVLFALNVAGWRKRLLGHTTPAKIESLAVLPLRNLSGDSSQEYFADGMTEQLISDLTQIHSLRVISLASVMEYKKGNKTVPQIAHELHVDGIVQGAVLHADRRVRINVELTRAAEERNLWSQSYERDLNDVLALQSEVAKAITEEIQIKLTEQERALLSSRQQVVPEAFDTYLEGRFHLEKRTTEEIKKAIALFNLAIARDPTYASAYVGLADSYALYRAFPPNVAMLQAKYAAQKALELNPNMGEGHASLAGIKFFYLDWNGVEQEFERALELNPGYATAHHWYALYLAASGDRGGALKEIRVAQALDPNSAVINANIGWCYFIGRQYDDAINHLNKMLGKDPNFAATHEYLGQAYLEKHMYGKAIAELRKGIELSGGSPLYRAELANAYATAGERQEATRILQDLQRDSAQTYVSAYEIALIYSGLNDSAKLFEWLKRALEERSTGLVNLKVHPRFDAWRGDPRFEAFVRNLEAVMQSDLTEHFVQSH